MKNAVEWQILHELFAAYSKGDEKAGEAVMSQLYPLIERFFRIRASSRQDAEDLTQIALLKIHFNRCRFDDTRSFRTWVFTIASRCLVDLWRSSSQSLSEERSDLEDVSQEDIDNVPLHLQILDKIDIERALQKLHPYDRSIIYLYAVEQLSMAEIATSLSLSENAVKIRAHRSYVILRQLLNVALFQLALKWGQL